MRKALAIKELRESAAIIAVAALAMLWLLGNQLGWRFTPYSTNNDMGRQIPFLGTQFAQILALVGGALAIGLGLKQTAWENSGDKYYYLLHRPITRQAVFLTKMAIGLAVLLLFTVGPLLIYANWAATPGNHATPFFWGMTADAWRTCWALPSIYLAALLSGLRPARWFGTRLFPLLGTGVLVMLSIGCWVWAGWWWGLAGLAVLDFVLLRLILASADQRDY
jgi:hypothetical protein